jgi:putative IMPACT (imprinted ancient) family translation regulator
LEIKDTYTTIAQATDEVLFKEKSSKFFGYAYPIQSEEEVKPLIDSLRKQHPHAVHYCYAYQIGTEKVSYRANDDGEPRFTIVIRSITYFFSANLVRIAIVYRMRMLFS